MVTNAVSICSMKDWAFYRWFDERCTSARNRVRLAIVIVGGASMTPWSWWWIGPMRLIFSIKFRENGMTPLRQGMLLALNFDYWARAYQSTRHHQLYPSLGCTMTDGLPTDSQKMCGGRRLSNVTKTSKIINVFIRLPLMRASAKVKMLKQLSI